MEEKEHLHDTTYHLKDFNLAYELHTTWQKVGTETENFVGFKKKCTDSIFCPTLTFIRLLDHQILNSDDDAIFDQFLAQLKAANYENVRREEISSIHIPRVSPDSIKCFEFSFSLQGLNFVNSSCIVNSKRPFLISFLTKNQNLVIHRNELNEATKGLSNE